ncbi:MAG TPA: alpha/beta hydrolase [Bryobacteraceae bacterium]|nr:alpha/beta hydrolase [Bryobacteraceae bacterium]
MLRTILCCSFLLAKLTSAAPASVPAGQEIPLWQDGAPNAEAAADVSDASADSKLPKHFTVVHHPSLYVFLPPKGKANGLAMVVAPGGGHSQLVIDKEGWEIAEWLNKNGVAAFVLKYRLARAKDSHYTVAGDAMADSTRALRLVRSRAEEWGVDPKRLGFIGFSAGGELTALMETRFDAGNSGAADPIERQSSRPDFTVNVYPGFRPGTITVPKDAPPAFLVCADDDPSHVVTTVNLYLDLQKQGISSEMHIYDSGKHGFGLRAPATLPVSTWTDRLKDWLTERKLL